MHKLLPAVEGESERYRLSTESFAAQYLVEPQTVRKQYAATGSYHGIRPVRLPNRKLLWPADSIKKLLQASTSTEVA